MKFGMAVAVMLIVVPLQVTVLNGVSVFGVRPDLGLIAACIAGFWFGPVQGVMLGLTVGFGQDLFSAGELWLNMMIKSAVGLASGILAKNLTNTFSGSIFIPLVGFSVFSGVILMVTSRAGLHLGDFLEGFPAILLPQALFDGLLGIGANWAMRKWIPYDASM